MNSKFRSQKLRQQNRGFTLTECLVTVSIAGILGAISAPMYLSQSAKSCQRYPESLISQIMTQAMAYNDEFGTPAEGWRDLDKIATIMTSNGPANSPGFNPINLPSCNYSLRGSRANNKYIFNASVIEPEETTPKNAFNFVGCINVSTGASDMQGGDGTTPANPEDLTCN